MNAPEIHLEADAFQGSDMSRNAAMGTAYTGLDFTRLRGSRVQSSQKAAACYCLRGKTLELFDMLADGGAVQIEPLSEGLSRDDGTGAQEIGERVGRYLGSLNLGLKPHGLVVGQDGAARYVIERATLSAKDSESEKWLGGFLVGRTVRGALQNGPLSLALVSKHDPLA
jgi:hypothetical protein